MLFCFIAVQASTEHPATKGHIALQPHIATSRVTSVGRLLDRRKDRELEEGEARQRTQPRVREIPILIRHICHPICHVKLRCALCCVGG